MANARVLIIDDHPLSVEGLALAVRVAAPDLAIDRAGTIAEAEMLARDKRPIRLVLLDLLLPDARGLSGLLRLQHVLGTTPILIVSVRSSAEWIEAARALGTSGYLSKASPLDEIAHAIRDVLAGRTVFPERHELTSGAGAARERIASLSSAQLRVLVALADGKLNKQVAADLNITEATVKAHLTAIFRALGVTNRTQALLALQPLLGEGPAEDVA